MGRRQIQTVMTPVPSEHVAWVLSMDPKHTALQTRLSHEVLGGRDMAEETPSAVLQPGEAWQ